MSSENSKPVSKEEIDDGESIGSLLNSKKKPNNNAASKSQPPKNAKLKKEEKDDDFEEPISKKSLKNVKPKKEEPSPMSKKSSIKTDKVGIFLCAFLFLYCLICSFFYWVCCLESCEERGGG